MKAHLNEFHRLDPPTCLTPAHQRLLEVADRSSQAIDATRGKLTHTDTTRALAAARQMREARMKVQAAHQEIAGAACRS